jgi:hypothetical protein
MLSDEVLMSDTPGYEWVLDHLLTLDDPLELFPSEIERV